MIFGYARVSTEEQNISLQVDSLTKYGCDKIYQDVGSGTSPKREGFNKLLEQLREGDTIVVWKLDRLGRSASKLIELFEDFNRKKINFVSIKEKLDTSTAHGKFILQFTCLIAEMERNIISERTKAGLKSARARGRFGGRPSISKKDQKRIKKLYESKEYSIHEIKRMTGYSIPTIYKYVKK